MVVVDDAGTDVEVVVARGTDVEGAGAGAGTDVEVVDVEVVVVVGITVSDGTGTARPLKAGAGGNEPPKSPSATAWVMKRLKMVAGKDPPLTLRPRTLDILRVLPSG